MRITMLENRRGWDDNDICRVYEAGETYSVGAHLGMFFVMRKFATLAEPVQSLDDVTADIIRRGEGEAHA